MPPSASAAGGRVIKPTHTSCAHSISLTWPAPAGAGRFRRITIRVSSRRPDRLLAVHVLAAALARVSVRRVQATNDNAPASPLGCTHRGRRKRQFDTIGLVSFRNFLRLGPLTTFLEGQGNVHSTPCCSGALWPRRRRIDRGESHLSIAPIATSSRGPFPA